MVRTAVAMQAARAPGTVTAVKAVKAGGVGETVKAVKVVRVVRVVQTAKTVKTVKAVRVVGTVTAVRTVRTGRIGRIGLEMRRHAALPRGERELRDVLALLQHHDRFVALHAQRSLPTRPLRALKRPGTREPRPRAPTSGKLPSPARLRHSRTESSPPKPAP